LPGGQQVANGFGPLGLARAVLWLSVMHEELFDLSDFTPVDEEPWQGVATPENEPTTPGLRAPQSINEAITRYIDGQPG